MRYFALGGRQVSVIGLGVWQFGSRAWGWNTDFGQPESRAIVQRALDLGVNLFDTAEIYAGGASERLLGGALRDDRDRAFVASKVWPLHALRRQVRSAAERSLRRLSMDHIDLYQVHWPNPVVPISWTMAGMRDLLDAGKVRAVGVSNFSVRRWEGADRALGAPVVANQVAYHLLHRRADRALLPFAEANGRVIIAYSPLAQGLLSGRYDESNLPGGVRRANTLFTPESLRRSAPVLDVLREVALAHRARPAQIALAWIVQHPVVVAIPGAKSVAQIEENAAAADIALTSDEMAALDEASARFTAAVSRQRVLRQMVKRLIVR